MQYKKIVVVILLWFLFPLSVFSNDVLQLPDIVVSASRSYETAVPNASNIIVIRQSEIETSGARSLADLLKGKPGIFVSDLFGDGSNASIDMRGFGGNANANTLVMIDGRQLNFSSDSGTLYLNSIDLSNIKQVEIVQGSSGVLFGNMAVGGVINIITKKPQASLVEIGMDIGSFNAHQETMNLENILDNGFSFRVKMKNKKSDNYRDHNKSDVKNMSLLLDQKIANGHVFFEYEYLSDFIETPGALFLDEISSDAQQAATAYNKDYQDLLSRRIRIGFNQAINDDWRVELDSAYHTADRQFLSTIRKFAPGSVSLQDRKTVDFNPRLIGKLGEHQVTLGVDYQRTDYKLVTSFGPQTNEQTILSYYLQSVVKINPQLDAILGIRQAQVENYINTSVDVNDRITIGSLAVNYRVNAPLRLFARIDQNYRFARVDEHTNPVFGQPVGLKNQTGVTYEVGGHFIHPLFEVNASIYQLKLNDEISFDASGFSNINLDQSERKGISLNTQVYVTDDTLLGVNMDYVDSEITSGPYKGNLIPQVPEKRVRIFAETDMAPDFTLMMDAVYTGKQVYGGDFNNNYQKMDDYTIVNLAGLYGQDNWSLSMRLNNIFDKKYSESGSIGGDNVIHTNCISDGFGGFNCPAEFTAPERNFWLGVKVNLSEI